jgi:hypothetical protein
VGQGELASTSDLVSFENYLSSPEPQGFSVLSLLSRPFWWGLSRIVGSSDLGEQADETEWSNRKGEWVVPDLVEVCFFPLQAVLALDLSDLLLSSNHNRKPLPQ